MHSRPASFFAARPGFKAMTCSTVSTHTQLNSASPPSTKMPPCPECQQPFPTLQGMRDHRKTKHLTEQCDLCSKKGLSVQTLLAHARDKHPRKYRTLFFICEACDGYFKDEQLFLQHYQTSPIHPKCETCNEPYYDLPVPKSRVAYRPFDPRLSHCGTCRRFTLQRQRSADLIKAETSELPAAALADNDGGEEACNGHTAAREAGVADENGV